MGKFGRFGMRGTRSDGILEFGIMRGTSSDGILEFGMRGTSSETFGIMRGTSSVLRGASETATSLGKRICFKLCSGAA